MCAGTACPHSRSSTTDPKTARAHVRRSNIGCAPLARASVRPRRLAHRRREHDGPSRRNDHLLEVASGVRSAAAVRPDALVVGEHAHDARADLRAGAWHGTMNYAGFSRPVWAWLRGGLADLAGEQRLRAPGSDAAHRGVTSVATMRAFRAGVPWAFTLHSWAILDSHDSPRFRTMAGSRNASSSASACR